MSFVHYDLEITLLFPEKFSTVHVMIIVCLSL